jgi:AcrR family transcriptional regulator
VPAEAARNGAAERRRPVQERSRRRVAHVLETADRLLRDEGAAALTMTRLAREADVSVGSLYLWFPDRDAVTEALALRYLDEFKDEARAVVAQVEAAPSGDPAALVVERFAAAFRARPGFRALWFGGLRTEALRDATRPGLADLAAALIGVLRAEAPDADPQRVTAVAQTMVYVIDALLRQAFRADPDGDAALLAETITLLRAYVRDQLG